MVYCPSCGWYFLSFAPGPAGRKSRCRRCQALERHRQLVMILRGHQYLFLPPARVLDLAPNESVRRYLEPRLGPAYVTADKFMERGISVRADLTALGFASDAFDVVICYHLFEHIPEDHLAMAEVARVLKPGGIAFVQVPRKRGAVTDEDPSAPVSERIRRFGQDDHVRLYGDDFEERLRKAGLIPQTLRPAATMTPAEVRRYGLNPEEEMWICRVADWSRPSSAPVSVPRDPKAPGLASQFALRARRAAGRALVKAGLMKPRV